jgi:hypothetical protein
MTMFRGPDGKPNPKAPGRYQTHSAPRHPTTVAEAVAAGWSRKRITDSILGKHPGGLLRAK